MWNLEHLETLGCDRAIGRELKPVPDQDFVFHLNIRFVEKDTVAVGIVAVAEDNLVVDSLAAAVGILVAAEDSLAVGSMSAEVFLVENIVAGMAVAHAAAQSCSDMAAVSAEGLPPPLIPGSQRRDWQR